MLTVIPGVLDAGQVARVRSIVDAAEWVDGSATSGRQAGLVKRNAQLPDGSDAARDAGRIILEALGRSAPFIAAALPAKVLPPMFNRYAEGQAYGPHIDNAIHLRPDMRLRADLSATLFLEEPDAYDGGELVVEDAFGAQSLKLPAGHLLLYPASSLHRVQPVTRGVRSASFLWVQSMVRDADARRVLYELDQSIQALAPRVGQGDAAIVRLTGVYHNLVRKWADS